LRLRNSRRRPLAGKLAHIGILGRRLFCPAQSDRLAWVRWRGLRCRAESGSNSLCPVIHRASHRRSRSFRAQCLEAAFPVSARFQRIWSCTSDSQVCSFVASQRRPAAAVLRARRSMSPRLGQNSPPGSGADHIVVLCRSPRRCFRRHIDICSVRGDSYSIRVALRDRGHHALVAVAIAETVPLPGLPHRLCPSGVTATQGKLLHRDLEPTTLLVAVTIPRRCRHFDSSHRLWSVRVMAIPRGKPHWDRERPPCCWRWRSPRRCCYRRNPYSPHRLLSRPG